MRNPIVSNSLGLVGGAIGGRVGYLLFMWITRQGFYGDPRHGGNRDAASWKMLALPFPPVRGRGTTV